MQLILTEIKQLTAQEDISCDASTIYWSLPRPLDYSFARLADAILLFNGRFGRIRKGEKHLNMIFADENGEELVFNCLACINKLCFRNGYYPEEINEALLKYRKEYRIKTIKTTQHDKI